MRKDGSSDTGLWAANKLFHVKQFEELFERGNLFEVADSVI